MFLMRYFTYDFTQPLDFHLCGNLTSKDSFLHMKRSFNENVIILVKEGILFIEQNGTKYEVKQNSYIILKAGDLHSGFKKTKGRLSYFWVHFGTTNIFKDCKSSKSKYKIQECSSIFENSKVMLFFNQLLDIAQDSSFNETKKSQLESSKKIMSDYALSLIMLELIQENNFNNTNFKKTPIQIIHIIDYINKNYWNEMSIKDIASELRYNPEYLSTLFKSSTGKTIVEYLTEVRVEKSKILLTNYKLSIKEIAYSCGFNDDKYFMRVFKKHENMTPSEYASTFYKKNIN